MARWADTMTLTALPDRRVLATDGGTIVPAFAGVINGPEAYGPTSDAWVCAAPRQSPRRSHTATLTGEGRLVIVVGSDPRLVGGDSSAIWATNEWHDYRR